jgi:tyrosine-protein phosphatase SIW14
MMRRTFSFLALLCVFSPPLPAQEPPRADAPASSASAIQPAFADKIRVSGIPNAGKINDMLYRGAQPRKQGLVELKKLGISTIVDLRGEDQSKITWERREAESLGMHFVHIPVSGWAPPTNQQVAQFLSLFRNDPAQKVFVHCRFGDDRTGVFVATYRMAVEKWTADEAMKEMYFFGFNGFWHPSMKSFIRGFPEQLKSSPSLAVSLAQKPSS